MPLDHWQLVKVSGPDAATYLQGQLTLNIPPLNQQNFAFSAHCDPKGKTLSNMTLFKQQDSFYYLERQSVAARQVADLKQYAVFSKVTIEIDNHHQMLGIAGQQASEILAQLSIPLPIAPDTLIDQDSLTVLRLSQPALRYLIVAEPAKIATLKAQLEAHGVHGTSDEQWLSLDIEAGYPIIDEINFGQFLPQAMSLEKIGGISFDKGCYRGQEMVARAQFRGANKRALYRLIGTSPSLPVVGDSLEVLIGEHARDSGHVLAAVRLADERILVQAILNNDAQPTDSYRVKQQPNSQLSLMTDE